MPFKSGTRFSTLVPARVDFDPVRAGYQVWNRKWERIGKKIIGFEPLPTERFWTV